jgi:DNA-binding MarR family transcriptional regulator
VSFVSDATTDDEVPWLSVAEQTMWVHLVGMFMSLPAAIDAQLRRDSGINFFEYSILVQLERAPRVQMTFLAQVTGGSLSRLSHAVSRLERQGWVRRAVSTGGENRCTEASLTEAGREALVAAAPGHVREVRRLVFDQLTPEQVGQMQQICRGMVGVAAPDTARFLADALERAQAGS